MGISWYYKLNFVNVVSQTELIFYYSCIFKTWLAPNCNCIAITLAENQGLLLHWLFSRNTFLGIALFIYWDSFRTSIAWVLTLLIHCLLQLSRLCFGRFGAWWGWRYWTSFTYCEFCLGKQTILDCITSHLWMQYFICRSILMDLLIPCHLQQWVRAL